MNKETKINEINNKNKHLEYLQNQSDFLCKKLREIDMEITEVRINLEGLMRQNTYSIEEAVSIVKMYGYKVIQEK